MGDTIVFLLQAPKYFATDRGGWVDDLAEGFGCAFIHSVPM